MLSGNVSGGSRIEDHATILGGTVTGGTIGALSIVTRPKLATMATMSTATAAVPHARQLRSMVLDGRAHTIALYLNGKPAGCAVWGQLLASLRDDNAWLGRSQHPRVPFAGCFDEFRVYDVALSAADVAGSYRRGAERLPIRRE